MTTMSLWLVVNVLASAPYTEVIPMGIVPRDTCKTMQRINDEKPHAPEANLQGKVITLRTVQCVNVDEADMAKFNEQFKKGQGGG